MKLLLFPDTPGGNRSPSEDDDEFYDAQEAGTFTLNVPGESLGLLERTEAESNHSQGSDDGSSSEGDPAPPTNSDGTRADPFHLADTSQVDSVSRKLWLIELSPSNKIIFRRVKAFFNQSP